MPDSKTRRRRHIDEALIRRIAAEALGKIPAHMSAWDAEILKGAWDSDSGVVARISGKAYMDRGRKAAEAWSAILKVPDQRAAYMPYRKREAVLYASPLMERFPSGFRGPRLYGATPFDGEAWIWMEDVDGTPAVDWPYKHLVRAALLFGELQGRMSDPDLFNTLGELVDPPDFYRERHAGLASMMPSVFEELRRSREARSILDSSSGKALERTVARHDEFMTLSERMPQSLCHGDFCFMNLRSIGVADVEHDTVVICWGTGGS